MLTYFKKTSAADWNDWRWQKENALTQPHHFSELGIEVPSTPFRVAITPYYANLIDFADPDCPLRQQVVPSALETDREVQYGRDFMGNYNLADSLGEETHTVAPNLVCRYPDRALLLVTADCFQYCRFCTRKRVTSHESNGCLHLEDALAFLRGAEHIHDVLISGGDPLTLEDHELEHILTSLREIPHIKTIRIGTRTPVVLPMRITDALVDMLRRFHPLWMNIHFNHIREITGEAAAACEKIVNAGIPLGNQSVLLRNINNTPAAQKELVLRLIEMRIRPYYLYQCDLGIGTEHFRTGLRDGIDIISGLRGFIPGYAVPVYVVDAPGGGGKIPVFPETIVKQTGNLVYLKNYENKIFTYPEPDTELKGEQRTNESYDEK